MSKLKGIIWDTKKESIRGSFVNLMLTINIFGMFWCGVLSDDIATRLEDMALLIGGVYATSLGAWSYRKIKEGEQDD